jgi:hypothetical protein
VDKAVKNGIVQPGQYLVLRFDFSRVIRRRNINESMRSLEREINRGLLEFKHAYAKDLGESFVSETSGFIHNEPTGNLADLVHAVDRALQDIQKGNEKSHPLWDIRGVSLFQTTTYYNTS